MIFPQVQAERYAYHAIREDLENGLVNCMAPPTLHNSDIVYRVIAKIWPKKQTDIIRGFNVIKKDLRRQSQQPKSQVEVGEEVSSPQPPKDIHQTNNLKIQPSTTYAQECYNQYYQITTNNILNNRAPGMNHKNQPTINPTPTSYPLTSLPLPTTSQIQLPYYNPASPYQNSPSTQHPYTRLPSKQYDFYQPQVQTQPLQIPIYQSPQFLFQLRSQAENQSNNRQNQHYSDHPNHQPMQHQSRQQPNHQVATQQMNIRLNTDKQFKNSYLKKEQFSGNYDKNWCLHQKNFVSLCQSYKITAEHITRLFRMTLSGSALTLFDSHFVIDQINCAQVVDFFNKQYDSETKQEEMSEELRSLRIKKFRKEGSSDEEALESLVDCITTLYPLSLPSDRNNLMQKRFLRQAVSETD